MYGVTSGLVPFLLYHLFYDREGLRWISTKSPNVCIKEPIVFSVLIRIKVYPTFILRQESSLDCINKMLKILKVLEDITMLHSVY